MKLRAELRRSRTGFQITSNSLCRIRSARSVRVSTRLLPAISQQMCHRISKSRSRLPWLPASSRRSSGRASLAAEALSELTPHCSVPLAISATLSNEVRVAVSNAVPVAIEASLRSVSADLEKGLASLVQRMVAEAVQSSVSYPPLRLAIS